MLLRWTALLSYPVLHDFSYLKVWNMEPRSNALIVESSYSIAD